MNERLTFETAYERAGVITPGLSILASDVERYPIPGGGSRAVSISHIRDRGTSSMGK